jgi:hypothetical protein
MPTPRPLISSFLLSKRVPVVLSSPDSEGYYTGSDFADAGPPQSRLAASVNNMDVAGESSLGTSQLPKPRFGSPKLTSFPT